MLRIGAPVAEPASPQLKILTTRERKKTPAPFSGTDVFFSSGGVIAFATAPLSYVGRLRRPRNALFLQSRRAFA